MTDTEKLKDMLNNLINNKPEQAQVAFHNYLMTKLNGAFSHEAKQSSHVDLTINDKSAE